MQVQRNNTNTMKTRLEWYQDLPEDIRERAVRNTKDIDLSKKVSDFKIAILCGFVFEHTPEGHEFWMHVEDGQYDKARELLNTTP